MAVILALFRSAAPHSTYPGRKASRRCASAALGGLLSSTGGEAPGVYGIVRCALLFACALYPVYGTIARAAGFEGEEIVVGRDLAGVAPAAYAPGMSAGVAGATLEETIKAVGLGAGARVVGIASVDAFRDRVPEGYRPDDILPGARSVVVAGGDGPTAGAWRCPDHRVMEITGYDLRENVAIHAMCDHIERAHGRHAIQAPSLPVHGHEPPMSMMLAAELAGLGTRSLAAHIILNPEYGLLYYAALITTLPLAPDPPLDTPACLHPGCAAMYKRIGTTPCLRVCPACLGGTVKDGAIETSTYDRERCHSRAQTYGIGSFQKALLEIVNEDDPARRRTMIYSDFFTKSLQAIGFYRDSIAQCFECMRVCPVGRKHRKLR